MAEDLMRIAKTPTMAEIAGRNTDPRFYAAMTILPNPDPILRRAGKSDEVFDAIQADSHVIGEIRAIKADFLRFRHKIVAGGENPADVKALELCDKVLAQEPAPYTRWPDVFWSIAQSTFRGLSVQEIVWQKSGDVFVPAQVLDRPKRRFAFDGDGQLKVLTRAQPWFGIPAERLYFLVDRHMPSYDNPYGVALFSSCFWPYTFKHAGFRWFVKFCERFGIPMPKGTYPVGASEDTKKALEDALENLIEASYAALEEGSDIEVMEAAQSRSGQLPQGALIDLCNAEMSKALSSQTLATELTGNTGSRAASQTHMERASDVNEGDRDRIICTLNELWKLITLLNFGPDVAPPESQFEGDTEATLERAQTFEIFASMGGRPSRRAMADELGIELADPADEGDAMQPSAAPTPVPGAAAFARHAPLDAPADQVALDAAIDALGNGDQTAVLAPVLRPIVEMARRDPSQLMATLGDAYPKMDASSLTDLMTRVLFVADTWGRLNAADEARDAGRT